MTPHSAAKLQIQDDYGMEKLSFALNIEDDWPPVANENVWCDRAGDVYELLNAPFFIAGLAYRDKFTAKPDAVNGCIFEFQVTEASGHSLVWLIDNDDLDFKEAKQKLIDLGCSIEGFPTFRLHAIDVPAEVDCAAISATVDHLEKRGFDLAFPVWRHEVDDA